MKKILLLVILSTISISLFGFSGVEHDDIYYTEDKDNNEYVVTVKEVKLDKNGEIEKLTIFVQDEEYKAYGAGKEYIYIKGVLNGTNSLSGGSMNGGAVYKEFGKMEWFHESGIYGAHKYTLNSGETATFTNEPDEYHIHIKDKDGKTIFEKKYEENIQAKKEFEIKDGEYLEDLEKVVLKKYGINLGGDKVK